MDIDVSVRVQSGLARTLVPAAWKGEACRSPEPDLGQCGQSSESFCVNNQNKIKQQTYTCDAVHSQAVWWRAHYASLRHTSVCPVCVLVFLALKDYLSPTSKRKKMDVS